MRLPSASLLLSRLSEFLCDLTNQFCVLSVVLSDHGQLNKIMIPQARVASRCRWRWMEYSRN